ncbi:hypothetical protein QCA50_015650 [Cerrena zonata]|uniref:Peptide transporter PTR2 n=1 Tax=Cerrena zonata TaxID=2478898 RepID=A0AAW0FHU7_9APHY
MSTKEAVADSALIDEKTNHSIEDAHYTSSSLEELYNYDDPLNYSTKYVDEYNPQGLRKPTEDEKKTLRRVLGRASYAVYLICLVELAERASYYSVQGLLANFIQRPLPPGSTTGAPVSKSDSQSAGALGLGTQVSSALTLLLQFLAYTVPIYGGFVADAQIGKLKAIWIGVFAGFISHILFIIAAVPSVIAGGHGVVPTALGIITLAFGTGFIKPNLLPLLMDQYPFQTDMVKVLPSGEKIILDRQKSLERMTLVFYWAINIAALSQVAGAVIQYRIYTLSPCGYHASEGGSCVADITAWQEVSVYILSAASECFAMTTGYELAYTRSPPHMKGLVMALFLFTSAILAAIGEALTPVLLDPHLIWPFAGIAIATFVCGLLFLYQFRNLHKEMEEERIFREQLDRSKDEEELKAQNVGPTAITDDHNLEAVTSIKSAVGR